MRKNTNGHGLLGAVLAAVLVVSWIGVVIAFLFTALSGGAGVETTLFILMGIYLLVGLAIAGGVCYSLYQRWQEVKGGEEDEAKKY